MHSLTPQNDLAVSPAAAGDWPAQFGSVRDEFAALRSTCGVAHLTDKAKIRLTGADRVRWLNGMITNNVRDLAVGYGVYAFLLNPQGHILGDLTAYNRGDFLLVVTERAQREKILEVFDHYIIMDDVEVEDGSASLTTLSVIGPDAAGILKSIGIEVSELKPLQVSDQKWRDILVAVVRGESDALPSFEIWLAPEHVSSVLEGLEGAGGRPVGRGALELYRIALGMPRYGQDIRERDLPQETEQQRALNFNKGCYVGQEIVERIRSRGNVHRKFTGFGLNGPAPQAGAKIQFQDKDVGEVTSSGVIPGPTGDQAVALGYIRREVAAGKEVAIGGSSAQVSDLPFANLLAR